jgi:hypothetical protein
MQEEDIRQGCPGRTGQLSSGLFYMLTMRRQVSQTKRQASIILHTSAFRSWRLFL